MNRRWGRWLSAAAFVAVALGIGFGSHAGAAYRFAPARGGNAQHAPYPHAFAAGLLRSGSGNWRTLTHRNAYGTIIASPFNADAAGSLRGRALLYACGVNVPNAAWSGRCGVPWHEAANHKWILTDDAGNYVGYGDGYNYLADIGDTKYQRSWIEHILRTLRAHPRVDGVFIDNIVGSRIKWSTKYSDDASYRRAMTSFIRATATALRRRGWYVAANAAIGDDTCSDCGRTVDGTQWIWWASRIAPYVSALSMERWQQNIKDNSVRASGGASSQQWDAWERAFVAVQRLHRDFFAIDRGALTDATRATYLRASFLLRWNGGGSAFFYADDYASTTDPWNPAWMVCLGRPLRRMLRVEAGWRRDFANGVVLVNPSSSASQTFELRRTYRLPDGTTTRSITLQPTTAALLRLAR